VTHIGDSSVPRLLPGVRLRVIPGGEPMLLVPEGAVKLSATSAAVVESIDGQRDIAGIVARLNERFDPAGADIAADVSSLLEQFAHRLWIEFVS
jgi:pyrroloquinoline quinone biosynthesis protein D